eukprot:1916583-Lingulodinium_polyedra.AAC.1
MLCLRMHPRAYVSRTSSPILGLRAAAPARPASRPRTGSATTRPKRLLQPAGNPQGPASAQR